MHPDKKEMVRVVEPQNFSFVLTVYPQMVGAYHRSISAAAKQYSLLLMILPLSVEDGVAMHCGV